MCSGNSTHHLIWHILKSRYLIWHAFNIVYLIWHDLNSMVLIWHDLNSLFLMRPDLVRSMKRLGLVDPSWRGGVSCCSGGSSLSISSAAAPAATPCCSPITHWYVGAACCWASYSLFLCIVTSSVLFCCKSTFNFIAPFLQDVQFLTGFF